MEAARALDVDVIRALDLPPQLADEWDVPLKTDFANIESATSAIVEYAREHPFDAIVRGGRQRNTACRARRRRAGAADQSAGGRRGRARQGHHAEADVGGRRAMSSVSPLPSDR